MNPDLGSYLKTGFLAVLNHVFRLECTRLELNHHVAAQLEVIEQKIHAEGLLAPAAGSQCGYSTCCATNHVGAQVACAQRLTGILQLQAQSGFGSDH